MASTVLKNNINVTGVSSDQLNLILTAFNCHGFKQSVFYVSDLYKCCDILCLSETWLRSQECSSLKNTLSGMFNCVNFNVLSKSSMNNVDSDYKGRPYGGLAVIIKHNMNFKSRQLHTISDRLLAVGIYNSQNVLVNIILSVYMPYYDKNNANCIQEYTDVLDEIQSISDKYAAMAGIKIVGDFNAQLPASYVLSKSWYKGKGFSPLSQMLYDFLKMNDMCAADILLNSGAKYTYSCIPNNTYTWIDHICCPKAELDKIKYCNVIDHCPENISDHLPVSVSFELNLQNNECSANPVLERYIQFDWSSHSRRDRYCELLSVYLAELPVLTEGADIHKIDQSIRDINCAIIRAGQEAGCVPKRQLKPKTFWCPDLSEIRDKKRFWWLRWVEAGRPRSGILFEIYKDLKKKFRYKSRLYMNDSVARDLNLLNHLYSRKSMKSFWNRLRRHQRSRVSSTVSPEDFCSYYKGIMTDEANLSDLHSDIVSSVKQKLRLTESKVYAITISAETIRRSIKSLNTGVAAGADGICAEHLQYGLCDELCRKLASIYTLSLRKGIIPSVLQTGIIIPILKKSTADPEKPENYRPITLSSVYAKIAESIIMPEDEASDSQFGFREGRGTGFVTSLLNDIMCYYEDQGSPVYLASLDAERCFDSIWHDGLLHKLWLKVPQSAWRFIHNWYKTSYVRVRWNNHISSSFRISKGMKQGSLLSPRLFNIFIDELLCMLSDAPAGVRVFGYKINNCTYADDITLLSATCTGLQKLMDICTSYADVWRFRFGVKKTQLMIVGREILQSRPSLHLKSDEISFLPQVEMLGVTMDSAGKYRLHIDNRISACRRSMYAYSSAGIQYPGLHASVKSYIWKSVGVPTLLFGMECIPLSLTDINKLSSIQGCTVKNVLGLGKRNHHSNVLNSLGIPQVKDVIKNSTISLYYRIFQISSPARDIQCQFLANYLLYGTIIKNTMLDRIIQVGLEPINVLSCGKKSKYKFLKNGVTDSLQYLFYHNNYVKPWSSEHQLAIMLTKSF